MKENCCSSQIADALRRHNATRSTPVWNDSHFTIASFSVCPYPIGLVSVLTMCKSFCQVRRHSSLSELEQLPNCQYLPMFLCQCVNLSNCAFVRLSFSLLSRWRFELEAEPCHQTSWHAPCASPSSMDHLSERHSPTKELRQRQQPAVCVEKRAEPQQGSFSGTMRSQE